VAITVNAVNDAPVALDYAIYTNEGASTLVQILSGVIDVDGDVLTISITALPLHGDVVVNANGSLTYSPDPDFFGTDSFEYTVSDANGGLSSAVISITLGSVNDAPVSTSASATVQEDAPAEIELHTSDADDDVLTMVIVSPPAHGTLEIISTDGFVVLYTPAENYNGTDSFSYQVTDGWSYSEVATVSIVVVGANDLPVAADDEAKTKKKKTVQIGVLENDTDPDSVLYVLSVGEPGHGSVQIGPDGKTLIYTPNGWFLGTDSFTYTISDGVYSSTATVEVTVYAKSDGDDDDDGDDDSNGDDDDNDDNGNGDDDGNDNTDDGEGDGSGGGDGNEGDGNEGDDGNDETNEENEEGQSPIGDCVEEEDHDFGFEAECEDADKGRGFTAGAGWITLSEDAQILDDEAEENVVFGFIGKYLKNDPDPRGITLLHVHSADFTFFSMSHDSLVVDGAKAQFGGTGRVNGESGYSFMITVIDDRLSDEVDDDTLRIKIWNTLSGVVVVDSMPGAPDDADPTSEVSGFVFILKK
jgi:hypothetical protein